MKQLKKNEIKKYRDIILKEQKGVCWICGKPPNIACLDHHHKKKINGTGQIRGVLCSNCNVFLAKSENNCIRYGISYSDLPYILRKMADYIEKEQYELIHPSEKPPEKKLQKSSYNKLKKIYNGRAKFPSYPKSGKLTKALTKLFEQYKIVPKFYK